MAAWLGEIKCPKCNHWQIPMKFCPNCGYEWASQPTWSGTLTKGWQDIPKEYETCEEYDPTVGYRGPVRRCQRCGEPDHGSRACDQDQ